MYCINILYRYRWLQHNFWQLKVLLYDMSDMWCCALCPSFKKHYILLQGKQSRYWFRRDTCWQKTEIPGSAEEDGLKSSDVTDVPKLRIFKMMNTLLYWKETLRFVNENTKATFLNNQKSTIVAPVTLGAYKFWICMKNSLCWRGLFCLKHTDAASNVHFRMQKWDTRGWNHPELHKSSSTFSK